MYYIILKHVGKNDAWRESFANFYEAIGRIESLRRDRRIRVCTRDRCRIFRSSESTETTGENK